MDGGFLLKSKLVDSLGVEPRTCCVSSNRSNQLSYESKFVQTLSHCEPNKNRQSIATKRVIPTERCRVKVAQRIEGKQLMVSGVASTGAEVSHPCAN